MIFNQLYSSNKFDCFLDPNINFHQQCLSDALQEEQQKSLHESPMSHQDLQEEQQKSLHESMMSHQVSNFEYFEDDKFRSYVMNN